MFKFDQLNSVILQIKKHLTSHRHGTKGLVVHLRSIHSITKPETANDEEMATADSSEEDDTDQKSGLMSQKRSWVWTHYALIDKQSACCNHCGKALSHKDGTKGLKKHLEALHSISKTSERLYSQSLNTPKNTCVRSWVWPYYIVIDKLSARCKICKKVLARGGGTSGLMKHLQSQHSINESSTTEKKSEQSDENSWSFTDNLFENFIEFPSGEWNLSELK